MNKIKDCGTTLYAYSFRVGLVIRLEKTSGLMLVAGTKFYIHIEMYIGYGAYKHSLCNLKIQ